MGMKVIITGATGFIGRALSREMLEAGYHVVALSRNAGRGRKILGGGVIVVEWDGKSSQGWKELANGAYAIINLAGENISNGRWTQKKKQRILLSRLDAGKAIVEAVAEANEKPRVVIQSSGIGYYGSTSDQMVDESSPPGKGFLVEVAEQWEASTKQVESLGTRHVIIRTGVVLGSEGGALPRLLTPFRFFVGGPLGSGKQWFPWIHLDDEVKAIRFLMEREGLSGPFNLCAPEPVTMKEFCHTLGKVMRRPSWFPVPPLPLRLIFGEMGHEVLLVGQRAIPKKLLEAGYRFQYPTCNSAFQQILSSKTASL
jgi:uncharacterized protein (TIGR01777 family)